MTFHDRLVAALREDLGREPTTQDIVGDGEGPPEWAVQYRDGLLEALGITPPEAALFDRSGEADG